MGAAINSVFSIIGFSIGTRPALYSAISLGIFVISLLGFIFRLDVRMNLQSGFTSADAPSIDEVGSHVKFFGNMGRPWYMAVFAVARNNGSMLDPKESNELTTFHQYITQKMELTLDNATFKYRDDLCQPFCTFNSLLWTLLEYQSFVELKYPLSTIGPYKMNLGKFLFDRKEDESGYVTHVGTVATYFTTFINDTRKGQQLDLWEDAVLREVNRRNKDLNNTVELVLHGAHTVTKEVERGATMAMPYYVAGAVLLMVLVICSFALTSLVFDHFCPSRLLLAVAAVVSPVLASITAIGLMLLFGFHVNMLVIISPFLTLATGIGVDDAFLLSNTWMKQREQSLLEGHSPAERLQLVMEKVGAGIAVTSLTNVLGFTLGCIAPVPEIRLFCASVALSMLLDLVFQLTLYAPVLVSLSRFEPAAAKYKQVVKDKKSTFKENIRRFFAKILKRYSKFVASLWAEIFVVGLLIAYLCLSIRGISSLKTDMDGSLLIPADSQSNEGIRIMGEVVWTDFLSINYIIRKPPNFSDPIEYRKFDRMVKTIENTEHAIGPDANLYWVKDYLRYLANPGASKFDVLFGVHGPEGNDTDALEKGLDMREFYNFINTYPYTSWQNGVRYKFDSQNRTVITEMLLMIGYNETRSLAGKARLLTNCRKAASQFPEYDMVTFDTDSSMIDVILSVPRTTISTMLFTVIAIGVVFFAFSVNLVTAVVATLSVASICTGVLGFLHYWGCLLDPLTMVAVIMTAGLGVDFTVHIIFHYLMNEKKESLAAKRIQTAFERCALSTTQAGLSTFIVMFPVLFSPIGVYSLIAKAVVLVVIIGLVHGLFIVPVILASLPNCLTGPACCAECSSTENPRSTDSFFDS